MDGCGLRMWITIVGALQDGKGCVMDLRFPSVFSEDVTMRTNADCGLPSLVPSRMAEEMDPGGGTVRRTSLTKREC